jgi:hypothetical protein
VHFAEAAVADIAVMEALALHAHLPDDKDALLLVEAPLELLSCSICCCMTCALLAISFLLAICSCISHMSSFSRQRHDSSSSMTASISSS